MNNTAKVERIRGRQWMKIRNQVFNRDGWLCQACKAQNRITPAREIDHITPLEDGGDNTLDNLQALCKDCHESKSQAETKGAAVADIPWHLKRTPGRDIITIVGPPFSGKRDRALELAANEDLIVSVDTFAELLFGAKFAATLPRDARRDVLRVRNKALKDFVAGNHYARCINICPAPTFKERQFWRSISVDLWAMDYDPDTCKRKAERDLVGSHELGPVLKAIDGWR